jgi:hypothetical protein
MSLLKMADAKEQHIFVKFDIKLGKNGFGNTNIVTNNIPLI